MKFKSLHAFIAIMAGCVLAGCHADVDLTNIDKKAEVEMGVALPIGSIHAKIGDFLGNGKVKNVFIDNKGTIFWQDTFHVSRDYHRLDLAAYIPSAHLNLNVYDKLPAAVMIGTNKQVTGTGDPVTLDFPLTVKLNGINHPDSIGKERLDSALIEIASFASTIKRENGLPLQWDWIDRVTLDLGDRVHRPSGNTMVVYDKNDPNATDYGQRVETNVNDFSIVLMKNLHPGSLPEYVTNVVDSVQFMVHFTFTIPTGTTVSVPEGSGFDYQLDVQFLTYKAIWGMFEPSKDMHDEAIINLAESWGDIDFLTRASLPFSEPKVLVDIKTQVAGALRIEDAYIFSVDQQDTRHYAAFGANEAQTKTIDFQPDQWLPLTSEIGDSTTNMNIEFNNTPDGGRIDRLFVGVPKQLGYRFNVNFNQQTTPQIRITPNTAIKVNAIATLPLIFNEGLHLDYSDTIKEVKLSQYSIDSLLAEVNFVDTMKATDVVLFLTAYNSIPFDVKAAMRCYDEAGNMLMDPENPAEPLLLFPQDTITLVAPQYTYTGGHWVPTADGKTTITAKMSKKKMDMLPQIKSIIYAAYIDDDSLADEYKTNDQFKVKLTDDEGLTLKIGLTAHAEAIMDLDNIGKK